MKNLYLIKTLGPDFQKVVIRHDLTPDQRSHLNRILAEAKNKETNDKNHFLYSEGRSRSMADYTIQKGGRRLMGMGCECELINGRGTGPNLANNVTFSKIKQFNIKLDVKYQVNK